MRGAKGDSLFILLLFAFLLGALLLSGCNAGGYGLANPEKEVTITTGSGTCTAATTSNFTATSSISQGYSSVSVTMVTCVNGECETYHFEKEETF